MKGINFKKIAAVSALGLAVIVGGSETASAQNRNKIAKQQQKIIKQELKLEKERLKLERQHVQAQRAYDRLRVNRSGRWYNVDNRQAELLRQAVNAGYRHGYQAGRQDSLGRRSLSWNNSSVYRSGTYGYQSYVDRSLYQHYFQQGFQRGYEDGFNSQARYGYNSNGTMNILGSILGSILNIQRY